MTGPIKITPQRPAESEETYVLVPVVGEPDEFVTVFGDGSYTRWIPGCN